MNKLKLWLSPLLYWKTWLEEHSIEIKILKIIVRMEAVKLVESPTHFEERVAQLKALYFIKRITQADVRKLTIYEITESSL